MATEHEQPKGYQQGYDKAVTAGHITRTAEVEGAFVLPHLQPTHHLLDVGCGPGTISASFAKYVPDGTVTGIDLTPEIISQAEEQLAKLEPQPRNVSFQTGNVLEGLPFEDGKFDVVFCSQTLAHISDPIKALTEMKRVCRPGGIVCCREGDMPFRWVPYPRGIQLFQKYLYLMVMGSNPVQPDSEHPDNAPFGPKHRSGSLVHVWARKAGFDPARIVKSARTTMYTTPEETRWYAALMVGRMEKAGHRQRYMDVGATEEEVDTIVRDLKAWGEDVDAWHCIVQCEVICRN